MDHAPECLLRASGLRPVIIGQIDQKGGTWDSVDAVGIHYVTGTDQKVRDLAQKYNKEIWYSEGCATFGMTSQAERRTDSYVAMGGNQSPLAMVDGYLNSFVFSNMTHYIFQPAIGGFYDGLQYAHKDRSLSFSFTVPPVVQHAHKRCCLFFIYKRCLVIAIFLTAAVCYYLNRVLRQIQPIKGEAP